MLALPVRTPRLCDSRSCDDIGARYPFRETMHPRRASRSFLYETEGNNKTWRASSRWAGGMRSYDITARNESRILLPASSFVAHFTPCQTEEGWGRFMLATPEAAVLRGRLCYVSCKYCNSSLLPSPSPGAALCRRQLPKRATACILWLCNPPPALEGGILDSGLECVISLPKKYSCQVSPTEQYCIPCKASLCKTSVESRVSLRCHSGLNMHRRQRGS